MHADAPHPNCAYLWLEHSINAEGAGRPRGLVRLGAGRARGLPGQRAAHRRRAAPPTAKATSTRSRSGRRRCPKCASNPETGCVPYYRWVSDYIAMPRRAVEAVMGGQGTSRNERRLIPPPTGRRSPATHACARPSGGDGYPSRLLGESRRSSPSRRDQLRPSPRDPMAAAMDPGRPLRQGVAAFRLSSRRRRGEPHRRRRRVLLDARPVRLGQDHLPPADRRLRAADRGHIEIFGETAEGVPPYRRAVNTVFQDYALFPHMSVGDNVAYGLMVTRRRPRRTPAAGRARCSTSSSSPAYEERRPAAALRRAAPARGARPGAGGDGPRSSSSTSRSARSTCKLREQMQVELKALQRAVGISFVYVTHDQGEALSMSDRVAVFNQGRIVQTGSPDRHLRAAVDRASSPISSAAPTSSPPDFARRSARPRRVCGPASGPRTHHRRRRPGRWR